MKILLVEIKGEKRMKNSENFFEKVKKFIKNVFKKNQPKMLADKNNVHKENDIQNKDNYSNEKERILNLYNDIKSGDIDVLSLSKSDLNKLVAISNEEINILQKVYNEKLENLQKVI